MLGIDIFISYRRSDRPTAAKEIADVFAEAFGADEVFFDQQTELGIEYPDYIRANLRLAKVVLVIVAIVLLIGLTAFVLGIVTVLL